MTFCAFCISAFFAESFPCHVVSCRPPVVSTTLQPRGEEKKYCSWINYPCLTSQWTGPTLYLHEYRSHNFSLSLSLSLFLFLSLFLATRLDRSATDLLQIIAEETPELFRGCLLRWTRCCWPRLSGPIIFGLGVSSNAKGC
jgi:hypothetical protein